MFQYIEHPKIKFYTFFTHTNQKKSAMVSFSMFSLRSKMKNRVKIIDFLLLLRISRKVIITEQWTNILKDLVLSYKFTKLFKSVKK
jgi:hypothetical protein